VYSSKRKEKNTTGKTADAVRPSVAVCSHTANNSLLSNEKKTHDKQKSHDKEREIRMAMQSARQRGHTAHGKAEEKRTTMKQRTTKLPLLCIFAFAVRLMAFSLFSFLLYLF
jgi:cation transport ATPase